MLNEFERRSRAERLGSVAQDIDGVLDEMDERYVEMWRNAKTVEGREDAHRFVKLIWDFRNSLRAVALDGAMAREAIASKEKRNWIPRL